MRLNRLAMEAIVVGVLILATVLHAVADSPRLAAPAHAGSRSVDSTTVDRLTRVSPVAPPAEIRATAVDTGTLAAMLAADLLLGPIDFTVVLPIVIKQSP
jgi:hypothetical protein